MVSYAQKGVELMKVTMNLTERDVKNTEKLTARLHSRSKAATVSTALSVTAALADIIEDGGTLMIRNQDGSMEGLTIIGLTNES